MPRLFRRFTFIGIGEIRDTSREIYRGRSREDPLLLKAQCNWLASSLLVKKGRGTICFTPYIIIEFNQAENDRDIISGRQIHTKRDNFVT